MRASPRVPAFPPAYSRRMRQDDRWARVAGPVAVVVLLTVAGCSGSGRPAPAASTTAPTAPGTPSTAGTASGGSAPGDLAGVRLVPAPRGGPAPPRAPGR